MVIYLLVLQDKIDDIVLRNNGKLYLAKDSRVKKNIFKKINKEFYSNNFKNFRRNKHNIFQSIQSQRLGI